MMIIGYLFIFILGFTLGLSLGLPKWVVKNAWQRTMRITRLARYFSVICIIYVLLTLLIEATKG